MATISSEESNETMLCTRISSKITVLLAVLLVIFPALVLVNSYYSTKSYITTQLSQSLRLALQFDLAIRHYIGDTVRPAMEKLVGADRFIPETMSSSFVARAIFDEVAADFPDMQLKFSSRQPRNPKNLAGPEEEAVIAYFEAHPEEKRWQGEISMDGRRYLALLAPRRVTPPCLQCHGDPAQAPADLVARYGRQAGFSYQLDQIIATDTVALSQDAVLAQLRRQVLEEAVIMVLAVAGIFIGVFWGVKVLVLNRIQAMARYFRTIAGQTDQTLILAMPVAGHDEIDDLARGFNEMAARLAAIAETQQEESKERERNNERLRLEISERRRAEEKLHELFSQQEETILQRTNEIIAQHASLQEAHEALKQTQSQLLQREKMASVGQLAAGVAHEINNPVGFVHSNLSTLTKYLGRLGDYLVAVQGVSEQAPEAARQELAAKAKQLKIDYIMNDAQDLIRECLEGTNRVKEITMNLKNFSRVDHQESQAANLNTCLEETLRIVWNELKYKATVIKDYGELPETVCYPQQLNQVFVNILVNAAQAMVDQGEIRITTRAEGEWISVAISDTGPGIPEAIQHRLFEPFFTTKAVGKGTGLGLSISYDIVKKHGGEITLHSQEGQGTTFTIRIPIRQQGDGAGEGQ